MADPPKMAGGSGTGQGRRSTRIPLALKVVLAFDDVSHAAESETLNVSRQGLFIRTPMPRPVGTLVRVEVSVGDGRVFELHGTVVHQGSPTEPGMGLSLSMASDGWKDFVTSVIARREDLAESVDVDLD